MKDILLIAVFLDVDPFLDLEEHEAGQVFFLDTSQVWGSKNGVLNLRVVLLLFDLLDILLKREYLLTYLVLGKPNDILNRVFLLRGLIRVTVFFL